MRAEEFTNLPNENSNGKPITHNPQFLSNFWKWFGKSKVVDEQGRPMVMYHGTSQDFARFAYEYADKGNGAYGMGFYFTNMPHTASGYAGGDYPNVIPTYLNIKKPMPSDYTRTLNRNKVQAFLLASPTFEESLSNYGDIENEGKRNVLNTAVDQFVEYGDTLLRQLNSIANDFYRDQNEAFLNAARKITGFDGVMHQFENGEIFFIAWDSNQIKSVTGNTGKYAKKGHSLVDSINWKF